MTLIQEPVLSKLNKYNPDLKEIGKLEQLIHLFRQEKHNLSRSHLSISRPKFSNRGFLIKMKLNCNNNQFKMSCSHLKNLSQLLRVPMETRTKLIRILCRTPKGLPQYIVVETQNNNQVNQTEMMVLKEKIGR